MRPAEEHLVYGYPLAYPSDRLRMLRSFARTNEASSLPPGLGDRKKRLEQIMANIKSQKKRILTNAKAQERNKAVRSELKTRVKTAVKAAGSDDGVASLKMAVKRLDMAATKGVIHKNQAANRKSKLMKRVNAAIAAATAK